MRREQLATGALLLLTVGLVGAALMVVGGPLQGRLERRDDARMDDLRAILWCLEDVSDEELASLTSHPLKNPLPCGRSPDLVDPYTQEPYTVRQINTDKFALCAKFEQPKSGAWDRQRFRLESGDLEFDPESGCLTFAGKKP